MGLRKDQKGSRQCHMWDAFVFTDILIPPRGTFIDRSHHLVCFQSSHGSAAKNLGHLPADLASHAGKAGKGVLLSIDYYFLANPNSLSVSTAQMAGEHALVLKTVLSCALQNKPASRAKMFYPTYFGFSLPQNPTQVPVQSGRQESVKMSS